MSFAPPAPRDMFADAQSPAEVTERFEVYKSTLAECHKRAQSGQYAFDGRSIVKAAPSREAVAAFDTIEKALSPEQLTAVQSALDTAKGALDADIVKDWTNSNPLATGLVPYDLLPTLQMLVPRNLTLRNSIARIGGQGSAKEFRQITGVSNAGVGGVPNQTTFFSSDSASTAFGPVSLRRPGKISYAANRVTVPYMESGVSDQVNYRAQFEGMGYADLRQLSHTAALWAHLLGEERNFLYARGTASPFSGAVAAPGVFTAAAAAGGSLPAATYYIKLTSYTGQGESLPTAEVSQAATANQKITLTLNTAEPAGLIAYGVYVGTASGAEAFQGFVAPTGGAAPQIVISSYTAGGAAVPAADGSASALAYDGLLTVLAAGQGGYLARQNAALAAGTPGSEFQTMFQALYAGSGASAQARLADPEQILLTAAIRNELSGLIATQGGGSGYRLQISQNEVGGVTIGSVVTAIQNQTTGRMVDLTVHPYMPVGSAVAWSKSLPIPDSGVSETVQFAAVDGADTLMLEWPVIQMTYDLSTYTLGSLLHYAPAWSGCILGIN